MELRATVAYAILLYPTENLITMVTEASCEEKTKPQTGIFRVSVQVRLFLRMCVYVCKCAYVFCNVSMCMYMCT